MKILKFSATWCNPCTQLSAILSDMTLPYEIEEIDIDIDYQEATKHCIRGVPTLVGVDDSGTELGRLVGLHPVGVINSWVTSLKKSTPVVNT